MALQTQSDEKYEVLRVAGVKRVMAFVDALPKAPQEPLGIDMKPYKDFDETHRKLRTPFSPDDEPPNAPLDQLPIYLRVPPDEGAIYIAKYTRSTLNFGIPLYAEEIILCALRLKVPIDPIEGEDEDDRYESCLASVRQTGRNLARYLTVVCNHVITFRLAAGLDGIFVFAMYSNYDRGERCVEERDEQLIIDLIGKVLGTRNPAKWYYEGYTT